MKISKLLLILLTPLVLEIFISCCKCDEPLIVNYELKTIGAINIDNSGKEAIESVSDSINKEAYGIRIKFKREKVVFNDKLKFSLFQSSYAFKCDCNNYEANFFQDTITDISIYTLNEFDSTHKQNSNITNYFKVYNNLTFKEITDFVKDSKQFNYKIENNDLTFDILLMTPPKVHKSYVFLIKISLSDGRVLETITNSIKLI